MMQAASDRLRRSWDDALFLLGGILPGIAFGLLYAVLRDGTPLVGAIYGASIGGFVFAFERARVMPRLRERLRQLPTPHYLTGSGLILTALIAVAFGLAGLVAAAFGLVDRHDLTNFVPSATVLAYALVASAAETFVLRVRDLVGARIFYNLLLGRYHRPIREERIFLFVDLVGSTALAERLGDLAAQDFVGRFLFALGEPVREFRGSIDSYIGDQALITWPLDQGIRDARCVRCIFAIADRLRRDGPMFRERFGLEPRFRAALHSGPVITAEVGDERHAITYFGDTVNTASRIEGLCRVLDRPIVASEELVRRIDLPPEIAAEPLGSHMLRGKERPLSLVALSRGS